MNGFSHFDATGREYSLGLTDDLVIFCFMNTISHELLVPSRCNLQGITTSPYWWPDRILEVKG